MPPVPALSLVGFMEQGTALQYLQHLCVFPNPTRRSMMAVYAAARQRLGEAIPNAGNPAMQDIPPEHRPYLEQVMNNPRYNGTVMGLPAEFKLVEINPLLCFQVHVETQRIQMSGGPPSMGDTLAICLPTTVLNLPDIQHHVSARVGGVEITSQNHNLRIIATHVSANEDVQRIALHGIAIGGSSPLVQVVRFEGRCYLKNGFHRAFALRSVGATHIPCILLEANDYIQVIDQKRKFILPQHLLESANPPTCGHFAQGRAYQVTLRETKRVIRISWSEDVVAE